MKKILVKIISAVLFVVWLPFLVAGSLLYVLSFYLRAFSFFLMLDTSGAKREAYRGSKIVVKSLEKLI